MLSCNSCIEFPSPWEGNSRRKAEPGAKRSGATGFTLNKTQPSLHLSSACLWYSMRTRSLRFAPLPVLLIKVDPVAPLRCAPGLLSPHLDGPNSVFRFSGTNINVQKFSDYFDIGLSVK